MILGIFIGIGLTAAVAFGLFIWYMIGVSRDFWF